jgi:hypothetical protein
MNMVISPFLVAIVSISLCSCKARDEVDLGVGPSHSAVSTASARNPDGVEVQAAIGTTFLRVEDPSLIARDKKECDAWQYSETQFSSDFKEMKEITQEEWGRRCYQYACSYSGGTELDGRTYAVDINAGGWLRVSDPSTKVVQYFASSSKSSSFLAACDCCEN